MAGKPRFSFKKLVRDLFGRLNWFSNFCMAMALLRWKNWRMCLSNIVKASSFFCSSVFIVIFVSLIALLRN